MMKSLPILFVVGLFVLPSGRALQCYHCSSSLDGDCAKPSAGKLVECQIPTNTSTTTTTTAAPSNSTTPPDGSGAGGEGSGAGGEGSGAGGVGGQIVYGGEGVQVVSGDEDEDEGAEGNGESNVVPAKERMSRAIVHHFSSKQMYADGQPKIVCVKKTTDTTVTRGCALDTECSGDNCHKCDTDACNSATSVAVYTLMMFGLLAFVFMTR